MAAPVLEVRSLSKSFSFGRMARNGTGAPSLRAAADVCSLDTPEPGPKPGTFWALKDVDFSLLPGESIGIIGRNGSGKSTLLRIISRIMRPTRGAVVLRGRRHSLLEIGTGFHPDLTGRKNIYLSGAIYGFRKREIDRLFERIVDFSGIGTFIDTAVKFYSAGMYVRLAFAVGVHLEPELLVIDEVISVGDAAFQARCHEKISETIRSGCALVFVSHDPAIISSLCRSAIWLRAGRVAARGDSAEVCKAYSTGERAHA